MPGLYVMLYYFHKITKKDIDQILQTISKKRQKYIIKRQILYVNWWRRGNFTLFHIKFLMTWNCVKYKKHNGIFQTEWPLSTTLLG